MHLNIVFPWQRRAARSREAQERLVGWLSLSVSILSGATFTSFGRQLGTALSPLTLVVFGESCIAFFLLLSFGLVPLVGRLMKLGRRQVALLALLGIFAVAGLMLIFSGLQTTGAANAELFGRSELIFTLLLAATVLHEPFDRSHILAASAVGLGITLVGLRGFQDGITMHWGDLMIVAGSLIFSGVSILAKQKLRHLPPELILFVRSTTSITCYVIALLFIRHSLVGEIRAMPLTLVPALIGFGFIARFLNTLSFYEAAERLPLSLASLVTPTEVIIAVFFAHFYLSEPLQWYHFIGGSLIVLGTLLLQIVGIHGDEEEERRQMQQNYRHR